MKKSSTNPNGTGNLEELFRHHFGEAEGAPRPNLWNRIDEQLEVQDARHLQARFVNFKRLAAACAALVICCSLYAMYALHWSKPATPARQEQPRATEHEAPATSAMPQPAESQEEAGMAAPQPADAAPAARPSSPAASAGSAVRSQPDQDEQLVQQPLAAARADKEELSETAAPRPAETAASPAAEARERLSAEPAESGKLPRIDVEFEKQKVTVEGSAPEVVHYITVTATARKTSCAAGAWGNVWLQLDNGTFLQPWENTSKVSRLEEGSRYKVKYRATARDGRFSSASCETLPAAAEAVSITQVQPAGSR